MPQTVVTIDGSAARLIPFRRVLFLCATRPPSAAAAKLDRLPGREGFFCPSIAKDAYCLHFRQDFVFAQRHSVDSSESAEWLLSRPTDGTKLDTLG